MARTAMSCTERAKREVLPLALALYHAGQDYRPGGIAAIAAIYGRKASTLQHKLSPTQATHAANPYDIEEVTAATRDPRIMDSMCEAFGDACWVDLRELLHGESLDGQTVASVINATGEALAKQSALMNAISAGLANDGRIDRGELAACKLQMRQAQASLVMLERVLERDAEEYDNGR